MACRTCHEGNIYNVNEQGLMAAVVQHAIIWAQHHHETEMVIVKTGGAYRFRTRGAAPFAGETIIDNLLVPRADTGAL